MDSFKEMEILPIQLGKRTNLLAGWLAGLLVTTYCGLPPPPPPLWPICVMCHSC